MIAARPGSNQPQPGYQYSGILPKPTSSGNVDLSHIKPSNSGSVSLADAIARARSFAAEKGILEPDRSEWRYASRHFLMA